MTREERAITNLKQMCSDGRYLGSGSYAPLEVLEDFNLAIKALEQEPTTKNDLGVDLISRADARKVIIDHQYSDSFCEEHNIDHSINMGMALIVLSDLPSVTPQEPKIVTIAEIKYDKDKLKELVNKAVLTVIPQVPCDICEVGNPCLYCKHEFEPQESEEI